MAFNLTIEAEVAASQVNIVPQIVLEIEGVETLYGSNPIQKYIQYGDAGLTYGSGFTYGGLIDLEKQESLISFQQGTSTNISQQLNQDKGIGDSISTINIALVDKDNKISKLISPGQVVDELLGKRCRIWFGFKGTPFKSSYIPIFRGNLTGIVSSQGLVTFKINHPDDKKRTNIYKKVEQDLTSLLTVGATVANVADTGDFLEKIAGPSGSISSNFRTYLKINDEIMEYQTLSGTQFQTLTRGALGTTAVEHNSGDTVSSFYRIDGNGIDIALAMMLSGRNGPFQTGVSVGNFVRVSATQTVTDSIFFNGVDVVQEYNLQIGDYITTTGASNGANNVSLKEITGIINTEQGSYITIDAGGVLVEENDSAALIDFRSQHDIFPDGMKMHNDECDIAEHDKKKAQFFSSFEYDFYIDDGIEEAKEFLSTQVYLPMGAFSLPRKSQASLGAHFPPLPTSRIKIINSNNVKAPDKLKLQRSTNANFYNSIVYKFDRDVLDAEKFLGGNVEIDGDSITRFGADVGNKTLVIEALGMRTALSAPNIAASATNRRLNKYKFGAEEIKDLKTTFGEGFNVEAGDIILFEMSSLNITDIATGTRNGESRLFEVVNKSINLKTGDISLNIVDTSFDKDARYGLISHSSFIKSASSTTQFVIKPSFNTDTYGENEFKKWEPYVGASVVVRSSDYSVSDVAIIKGISGNSIQLETALSFTPLADYIMELSTYDDQPDNVKLVYTFMTDNATFSDGKVQYTMF